MTAAARRLLLTGAAGLVAVTVAGCGAASSGSSVTATPRPVRVADTVTGGASAGGRKTTSSASPATMSAPSAAPQRPSRAAGKTAHPVGETIASRPEKNPDGPEPLPAPAPGVPTGPGTVNPTTVAPCDLVTAADAAKVLGASAQRFSPEQEPDDKAEFAACGYRTADHSRSLLLDIAIDQNAVYDFDSYWGPGAAGGPMGAVSTRIPQLGDQAYELVFTKQTSGPRTRNLGVVSHGVVVELHASSSSGPAAGRRVLVAAARAAIARLA